MSPSRSYIYTNIFNYVIHLSVRNLGKLQRLQLHLKSFQLHCEKSFTEGSEIMTKVETAQSRFFTENVSEAKINLQTEKRRYTQEVEDHMEEWSAYVCCICLFVISIYITYNP